MRHPLNQHRKKRFDPYADVEAAPEFQVAPMVDVLLVLLLFFMVTATTESALRQPDLILPQAEVSDSPVLHPGQSVINIAGETSGIKLGEQPIQKPSDLVPFLQQARESDQLLRGGGAGAYRVFIRADRETQYSVIKEIMQACAKAGISNIAFAVTNTNTNAGSAPSLGVVPITGGSN